MWPSVHVRKKKKKKKVFRDICASPFKNQVRVFSAATWIECGMPKYPSHGKKKKSQAAKDDVHPIERRGHSSPR